MSSTPAEPAGPAPGGVTPGPVAAGTLPGSEEAIVERGRLPAGASPVAALLLVYAVAFSIISITTGLFVNYASGCHSWGPATIWLWPIAPSATR